MKVTILSIVLFGSFAFADHPFEILDRRSLESQFLKENPALVGKWSEASKWDGYLCDGHYKYDIGAGAQPVEMRMDLGEDKSLDIRAEFKDLYFQVSGEYRSSYSACVTLSGWLGIGSDGAKAHLKVFMDEVGGKSKLRLKIVSTELGRLHFGKYVPVEFEDFATGLANRTLSSVWGSRLGDWLSRKISEIIEKKRPKTL